MWIAKGSGNALTHFLRNLLSEDAVVWRLYRRVTFEVLLPVEVVFLKEILKVILAGLDPDHGLIRFLILVDREHHHFEVFCSTLGTIADGWVQDWSSCCLVYGTCRTRRVLSPLAAMRVRKP